MSGFFGEISSQYPVFIELDVILYTYFYLVLDIGHPVCQNLNDYRFASYLVLATGELVGAGQEEDGPEANEPKGGEHQKDERPLPRPGRKDISSTKDIIK